MVATQAMLVVYIEENKSKIKASCGGDVHFVFTFCLYEKQDGQGLHKSYEKSIILLFAQSIYN